MDTPIILNENPQNINVDSVKKKVPPYGMMLFILISLLFVYHIFFSAPVDFVPGTTFNISEGATLRSVSSELKSEHLIRSRILFEAFVALFGGEKHVVESNYYFESKLSVFEVARRISKGEHHMAPVVVTIPEGFSLSQIVDLFSSKLASFDSGKFILVAKTKEGYLFPDTYFFLSTDTEEVVLKSMLANFDKKVLPILPDIEAYTKKTGKTEREIVTMASLVEGEAKGDADRAFIAGILWKRMSIGMPLQVDVAPETYQVRGLPKNPIGNPGLESLTATVHPQSSPYLYYLHDKDGNVHYAKTFTEHRQNVLKYLK